MHTILEVKQAPEWKFFHQVPQRVYKNYPHWIAPLEKDIERIFDPATNRTFEHGEAVLYVLLDDKGQPAGRIAAFVDHQKNKDAQFPLGGIGFFECTDQHDYMSALLEKAEFFLRERGVKAIDAIVNFGERDKFWGILAKGYDLPPLFQENYHPPYYLPFFEKAGYLPYEQILTLAGRLNEVPVGIFMKVAERIKKNNAIRVENFDFGQVDRFARDFAEIYNAAFADKPHFKPVEMQLVKKMMTEAKAILDPRLISIAYWDEEPVGFAALFPDINPILKFAKGKLNWWRIPLFLLKKRLATPDARGVAAGVKPAFQAKGVMACIVAHMYPYNKHREEFKLATVRSNNQHALSVYAKLGAKPEKAHIALRKPLDPAVIVESYPFVEW